MLDYIWFMWGGKLAAVVVAAAVRGSSLVVILVVVVVVVVIGIPLENKNNRAKRIFFNNLKCACICLRDSTTYWTNHKKDSDCSEEII